MKGHSKIIKQFFMWIALLIFSASCFCQVSDKNEFENLKNILFGNSSDISELPIYADPPTMDFNDFKKDRFIFQIDSIEIEKIKKYRNELEPFIVQRIDSGYSWVYLAAFLYYESAVPKIKDMLLNCDKFYGWEGGDYQKIERYLDDEQYCYQMAYIAAIEHITGKSISESIKLTDQENTYLKNKANKCVECNKDALAFCWARWLLDKLTK